MKRFAFLLLAAGLSIAAGPAKNGGADALPLPPIPPDMPTESELAPMPDSGARGPVALQVPRGPELSPTLMGPKYTYQGEAFLRGSTVQTDQYRKSRPAAGVNLTVPLQ